MKITGREMSTVSKDTFDGFWSVVCRGETMNSSPPLPPLPVTVTLLKAAVPPNELIPSTEVR